MQELSLRKVFPGVLFAKRNMPEKHVKKEISELRKDSTDVYKRNKVNRYMIRLKDSIFEHLCYALSLNVIS